MSTKASEPWTPGADWKQDDDPRLFAPATLRNRDAILDVLRKVLPATGLVLEVASGSGEHVVHFAGALPNLVFQPSDPSPEALTSIAAWINGSGLSNIRKPLLLDAAAAEWPLATADALVCINMIHIAPWSAAEGLIAQAARILARSAPLCLYGPYRRAGRALEPGNASFDVSLRARDPAWGLRELDAVAALAASAGFSAPETTEMPANNLSVVFRKDPRS